jgi:nitrate reductase NapD
MADDPDRGLDLNQGSPSIALLASRHPPSDPRAATRRLMNISGILVVTPPARLESVAQALDALPGVEVHHLEPATGRIVVVQEAETVDQEVAALGRIKAVSGVMLAEMVYHVFDQTPPEWGAIPHGLTEA